MKNRNLRYIDMNTELRRKKKWLWEKFFQVDEYYSFWKNLGKCSKYRDIKLVKL